LRRSWSKPFEFGAPNIRLNPSLRNAYQGHNMKTKSLTIIGAVVVGLFAIGTTLHAQNREAVDSRLSHPVMQATPITKQDAQNKYPPPAGGYPLATRNAHDPSGIVASPYPPYQQYDCSKVAHGGLVVDTRAKRVFVYP
jgi:hypothetical protein